MDPKKINNIITVLLILIFTVLLGYYVFLQVNKLQGQRFLNVVEVRSYQGQNLSSVNDFRENSIKGPQYIDKDTYKLKVTGLVQNPRNFAYDEIVNNFESYKKVVTLNCVEGWSVSILWEGILLKDLFKEVNPDPEAKTVIFHAADGYTTSFSIDYLINNNILMAYKMNDVILPAERGFPFQLVAESKWGYKWIKWITEIEFSSDVSYEGYWEKKGFSDTGDLNEPFLK